MTNVGSLAESDTLALTVIAVAIIGICLLAPLPGIIAEWRRHSQTTAIKVCGYIGFLTLGILWLVAIIWAFTEDNRDKVRRWR